MSDLDKNLKESMMEIILFTQQKIEAYIKSSTTDEILQNKNFWKAIVDVTIKVSNYSKQIYNYSARKNVKLWLNFLKRLLFDIGDLRNCLCKIISRRLFTDTAKNDIPIWCKVMYLKFIFQNCAVEIPQLQKIMTLVWHGPDYQTQNLILNLVVDYGDREDIFQVIEDVLQDDLETKEIFEHIFTDVDRFSAIRNFLKEINLAKNPIEIISFAVSSIELNDQLLTNHTWIDFNYPSKTISFECYYTSLSSENTKDPNLGKDFEVITIYVSSVLHIIYENVGTKITFELIEPCSSIYESTIKFLKPYRKVTMFFKDDIEEIRPYISRLFSPDQENEEDSLKEKCSSNSKDTDSDNIINESLYYAYATLPNTPEPGENIIVDESDSIVEDSPENLYPKFKLIATPAPDISDIYLVSTPQKSDDASSGSVKLPEIIAETPYICSEITPSTDSISKLPEIIAETPFICSEITPSNITDSISKLPEIIAETPYICSEITLPKTTDSISKLPEIIAETPYICNQIAPPKILTPRIIDLTGSSESTINSQNCNLGITKDPEPSGNLKTRYQENVEPLNTNQISLKNSGSSDKITKAKEGKKRRKWGSKKRESDSNPEFLEESYFSDADTVKYTVTRTRIVRKPEKFQCVTDSENEQSKPRRKRQKKLELSAEESNQLLFKNSTTNLPFLTPNAVGTTSGERFETNFPFKKPDAVIRTSTTVEAQFRKPDEIVEIISASSAIRKRKLSIANNNLNTSQTDSPGKQKFIDSRPLKRRILNNLNSYVGHLLEHQPSNKISEFSAQNSNSKPHDQLQNHNSFMNKENSINAQITAPENFQKKSHSLSEIWDRSSEHQFDQLKNNDFKKEKIYNENQKFVPKETNRGSEVNNNAQDRENVDNSVRSELKKTCIKKRESNLQTNDGVINMEKNSTCAQITNQKNISNRLEDTIKQLCEVYATISNEQVNNEFSDYMINYFKKSKNPEDK